MRLPVWLGVLLVSVVSAQAGTVQHVSNHVAGWRGGWNPAWHPRIELWPAAAAGAGLAEFDRATLQSEINAAIATYGGWDAKVIITQVDWVDDAIPSNLNPVVGAVELDSSTISWFSAYAYNAGNGSWRYNSSNYGSFAEAVLASEAGGDSVVFEAGTTHWEAVWKPLGEAPVTGADFWNIVIDVPESLITHYLNNTDCVGIFFSSELSDSSVTIFGYDQWGGSGDVRIEIGQPPQNEPWIVPEPADLSFLMELGNPVSAPQSVTVNDTGSGSLSWTAVEAPDETWMSITDTTGGDGDAFQVVVDVTGLSPGTYNGNIQITDPAAGNNPVDLPVSVAVFSGSDPHIELSTASLVFEVTPDESGPSGSVTVNNTAFGSLNWSAAVQGGPVSWLSLANATGSDGDFFNVNIDHSGLARGEYSATVDVTDSSADNSPQSVLVTLRVRDQDADIETANGYDDAWQEGSSGWVANCRTMLENKDPGERTQGFVVRLGDSITYSNPGGQWAHYGSGKTAEDVAICSWMHATDSWPDPIHNNSPNGWYLSRVDYPGRGGSYTARSSITTAGMLSGWGGLPSVDEMFTNGFANPDGKQYRDAEIVIILLGTNDVSGPRATVDFITDLESIVDKILANNTVAVLTTLPPRRNRDSDVQNYNAAVRTLAQTRKLPLIDMYEEMLRRRPGNTWDGTLISGDGVHPSESYGGYSATSNPYSDNGVALSNSGMLLWCWLAVQKVAEIKEQCIDDIVVEQWLDPTDPDVDVVLNSADTGLASYASPTNQVEWLISRGSSSTVRIKHHDDPALIKWDLSAYKGQTVTKAELHVARSNPSSEVFALAAATINSDWPEGTSGTAVDGSPSWRWRIYNASNPQASMEWTFPGSDFTTAAFGNFGSLVSIGYKASDMFKTYEDGGYTWIAMKLDPEVVHAMILDQYGVVITDARGRTNVNPSIYTREAGSSVQPRLYLKTVTDDTTPPGDVTDLSVIAGEWSGEVVISFNAPADTDDGKAFGYNVRYGTSGTFETATPVERWRIARPLESGTTQQVFVENLNPGQNYTFYVQAYDKVGNTGNVVSIGYTLPAAATVPDFADGSLQIPDPTGKPILGQAGILNYWACSELAKVNPANGARIADGYSTGSDDYKKANAVWDSSLNRITLHAGRNEVAGFQVIIERLLSNLTDVAVTVGDLTGPGGAVIAADENVELFKLHYVSDEGLYYADPAIPLFSPFAATFDVPSVNNPGGVCQSVCGDLYIPRDATAGTYTGTITIDCQEMASPITVELQVLVYDVVIPDSQTFFLDVNGYGNKWSSEASRFQVFQLCKKHKMVPNTLPYGWSGSVNSDRVPALTGSGPTTAVSDWTEFATNYGPFFDGSGFSPTHPTYPYHGPGENTPVDTFYTAFHEGWPVSLTDSTWGFDSAGSGWSYWNSLIDSGDTSAWHNMPDVMLAFPTGYETGYKNVARQFAQYAQDHGWHGTSFQVYLNNKYYYDPCIALWVLEEQNLADDFRADRYFMGLAKQGAEMADAPDVKWHWRTDTSTRWGQNWGEMRGICNMAVVGGDVEWYYRQFRYRKYAEPVGEEWWWYGTGPQAKDSLTGHPADILRQWSHGLCGGVPYWDNYHTSWTDADSLAVLPSGDNVPGHGSFEGRIATIRMKGMRYGQQLAEYLNLLVGEDGWNKTLVARALSRDYGDNTGNAYDLFGGDSYDQVTIGQYYQLHAELLATLSQAADPCDLDGNGEVTLADFSVMANDLSGPGVPVTSIADMDEDGDVDLMDFATFQRCFVE